MTSEYPIKRRKKLIEVAIPLETINEASAREKSIRQGHPSTLHLWWARRPLAAARAVIFCQMVDDPSDIPEEFPTEQKQNDERSRLFELIKELVKWENISNELVIEKARNEIRRSWKRCCFDNKDHPKAKEFFNPENLPEFHDPFSGGGTIPLEAQRLGLSAYATDLNPVAVLINKALIEIPYKYSDMPPVNPDSEEIDTLIKTKYKKSAGLAQDVSYYSKWVKNEIGTKISSLFPPVQINNEILNSRPDLKKYNGRKLKVIAWIWARTVKSPHPPFSNIEIPLTTSFILSTKKGNETYIKPLIKGEKYKFEIHKGNSADFSKARNGTKLSRGANFKCLLSGQPIDSKYIKNEGKKNRIGYKLLAIVLNGDRERVYLEPLDEHESLAKRQVSEWRPTLLISGSTQYVGVRPYGIKTFDQIYTERQLIALDHFSSAPELVKEEVSKEISKRKLSSNSRFNNYSLDSYPSVVATYIGICSSRSANTINSLALWSKSREQSVNLFSRQAIPMAWDFPEVNILGEAAGDFELTGQSISKVIKLLPTTFGISTQGDAQTQETSKNKVISTDPPYYDNIPYADLSDFFYVWLRKSLKDIYPKLFSLIASPKKEELVAFSYRHKDSKAKAECFFLKGMTDAMIQISEQASPSYPITIYYAFRQTEKKDSGGHASTGWEAFLEAVINSGLVISGTWPIRTERPTGVKSMRNNLASSIVLVCKKTNQNNKKSISAIELKRMMKISIRNFLTTLVNINLRPADMAQAAIGPGIELFSKSASVFKSDDSKMAISEVLIEINNILNEYLLSSDSELDISSQFAISFFESYGFKEVPYGNAESIAIAKNVSVQSIVNSGILEAINNKARIIHRSHLPEFNLTENSKLPCTWVATHHLINSLEKYGESNAALILSKFRELSLNDSFVLGCRSLSYRLYNHCEKTKQAEEARSYNGLVVAWQELERLADKQDSKSSLQSTLF